MPNLATVKAKAGAADAAQGTGGLLTSKVEAAAGSLLRMKLNPNQQWQKLLLCDRSGSMGGAYPHQVQEALNRDLAFSLIVDDDGVVPTCFFDDRIEELMVQLNDFHNLLARHRISARGTTDLTAALRWVAKITGNEDLFKTGFLGGAKGPERRKMKTPAFVTIIGDGKPDDKRSAREAVQRLSYRAVELKFIYVGDNEDGWEFLKGLDNDIPVGVPFEQGGRLFDNVDAKRFDQLAGVSDAVYYDAMFDEVPEALAAMKRLELI